MVRSLLAVLFVLFAQVLAAESLESRLRVLFPGDGPASVRERRMVEDRMEKLLHRLRHDDKVGHLALPQQLEAISHRLQQEILRTYQSGASLADAVDHGEYSDATAAIVTALCLDHFDIVHEIFVDHWEAYVIAAPRTGAYRLRHPQAALHDPLEESSFRREYLALWRTTADELLPPLTDRQSDSVFYANYYDPGQYLTFRQLSGYQQFRMAQHAYRSGDYDRVAGLLERARLLEDRPAFALLDRAATLQATSLGVLQDDNKTDRLFESWRREPANPHYATALLHQFDRGQQSLLAEGKIDAVNALLQSYVRRAPENITRWEERLRVLSDIRLLSHYQRSGKAVPALQMAENLYRRDPKNPHFRTYLAELTLYDIQRNHPGAGEQVNAAKAAAQRHAFLRDSPRYADIVLRGAALTVRDHFAAGREKEAKKALEAFRKQLEELPSGNDRRLWTMTAFVAASNYHFAEEEFTQALDYLDEALTYDPRSEFLIHQRDLIARY